MVLTLLDLKEIIFTWFHMGSYMKYDVFFYSFSIKLDLTTSGPRPNPQRSYHFGLIKTSRTIVLANSAPMINGISRGILL